MFNSIVLKKPIDIPDLPGSYQFLDAEGRIIYVGKAKSLKNRVGSYFQDYRSLHIRTRQMLESAVAVEWITVRSDIEAILLEYSLIKQHKPRFNVRLIDDKSYPYLMLTMIDSWPRAVVGRGAFIKGNRYFGPFTHAYAIRNSLDILLRSFPVRTCSNNKFQRHAKLGRPCLLYDIEKCSGPCVKAITEEDYQQLVSKLADVFDGNSKNVLEQLEIAMKRASQNLEFELAAQFRDGIDAIKLVLQSQEMVGAQNEEFDIIGIKDDDLEAAAQILHIHCGRVVGREGLILEKVEPMTINEVSQKVIEKAYLNTPLKIPSHIFINYLPADMEEYEELLKTQRDTNIAVHIKQPYRGRKKTLIDMAVVNAEEQLKRHRLKRSSDLTSRSKALDELRKYLNLTEAPLRIECYDMSHLQGTNYVGSMVVMEDGLLKKSDYRRYKVSAVQGNDDFGAMHEVLTRRLRYFLSDLEGKDANHSVPHVVTEKMAASSLSDGGKVISAQTSKNTATHNEDDEIQSHTEIVGSDFKEGGDDYVRAGMDKKAVRHFAYRPSLILLDGGKGQLSVGVQVVEELGLSGKIELAALAKRYEEVYRPGISEPMEIPRNSEAIFLLRQIRDEAHRFAIGFHRQLRGKRMTKGLLDEIEGLGEKRKKKLLEYFGSITQLKKATYHDFEVCTWLPKDVRDRIWIRINPSARDL